VSVLQGEEGDKVIDEVSVYQSAAPQATVFIVEDSDRKHGFEILQLNVFPLSSRPPKVKGNLSYEVPTSIAEFAKEAE